MDHYEELGLTRSATDQEIHKAHRRLSKLLHPDQHTDPAVKELAETQMRRLNSMVQVLSNPETRFEYDRELAMPRSPRAVARPRAPIIVPSPFIPIPRALSRTIAVWALCSALGATLFTLSGVWWWETRSGPVFGNQMFANQVLASDTRTTPEAPKPANADDQPHESLTGEWVYIARDEEKKAGVYLPESITLRLSREKGQLRGEFHARYAVMDKPMPTEIDLNLVANAGEDNTFTWRSKSGAQGTFKISSSGDNTIRTVWDTTVYSRESTLTSGAATLQRRQNS